MIVICTWDRYKIFDVFFSSYRDLMWHVQTAVAFDWLCLVPPPAFNVCVINKLEVFAKDYLCLLMALNFLRRKLFSFII